MSSMVEFTDDDAFGLTGKTGLTGNMTVKDEFQAHAKTTITISNASVDGVYQVKVWFREP